MFPQAEVFALPAIGSDHSPIILSLQAKEVKRKKEFKFEVFWPEHEEFKEVLKAAWEEPNQEGEKLTVKLKAVTLALHKWSKRTFGNSHKKIYSLKQEIQDIINRSDDLGEENLIKQKKEEIKELWWREEMYWGLRSRVNWLR